MAKTDKDILTTAETAKLLGVSTRTAQLLVEGGTIPSWKTPGGHRRVYRSDVMALIEKPMTLETKPNLSAIVVAIASGPRLDRYRKAFEHASGLVLETFEDVLAALVAVGTLRPLAVLVDGEDADRAPLLASLSANPSLAGSKIIAVAGETGASGEAAGRIEFAATPEDALTALSASFGEDGAAAAEVEEGVPVALNEGQRLMALERAGLVDTDPEDAFDRLTWLASQMLDAPISLLTLLTASRQWFKSRVGLDLPETPRSWAFCNHTIMQKEVFSIEDLSADPRFSNNPAVAGEPNFRFYAGAPVVDPDGFVVGSLCVIDQVPRKLDDRERRIISELAAIASDELRLRSLDRRTTAPHFARERAGANRVGAA
jgi:excisionase family DNA binding protein